MKSHCYRVTFGLGRSQRHFITVAVSEDKAIDKIVEAYGSEIDTEHVSVETSPNDIFVVTGF